MAIIVKTRHIGMSQERVHTAFEPGQRTEAEKLALQINCKPFTPYYAWVEEVASVPAQNQFIGGR